MALTKSNGIEIEYEDQGPKDAPAVLMLQGLAMQLIAWPVEMVDFLLDSGYRVIRIDNRDVGLSTKFSGSTPPNPIRLSIRKFLGLKNELPYRLEDMAADGVGVLDALGIKSAHLVGVSMGGMISQLMTTFYPDRVLSLTSINVVLRTYGLFSAQL